MLLHARDARIGLKRGLDGRSIASASPDPAVNSDAIQCNRAKVYRLFSLLSTAPLRIAADDL
jgi:hypothetical protein